MSFVGGAVSGLCRKDFLLTNDSYRLHHIKQQFQRWLQ
ncbi:hypothetical protein AVDCRST_MAG94-3449 [uncultured Leptolyngbya sp.]|uniref:Uncharacterized protein n=1 Tax=uncultured Leptolyngbya sp. TaxID=332963 RepID=A0A6J4MNT7_9CYAN|nr:hypothetical protein AVDCRST_MAG94-3449 [uncultured Leptolyngbya sp.]